MLKVNSSNRDNFIALNYFGKKITYSKLFKRIEDCAKSFKKLGIKRGDKVTICMPNIPEAIFCFYALNKIGAISSIIHPLSAEKEIEYYLNISESKMIVTIDLALKRINNVIDKTNVKNVVVVSVKQSMPISLKLGYSVTKRKKIKSQNNSDAIICWNDFITMGTNYSKPTEVFTTGNESAVILYSGGTSGTPKGVVLTNLNFNAVALQSVAACNCLKEKDKVLSIMPIFHGFGLGICVNTVLNFGGCAVIQPTFSSKTFDKLLNKYKPNVIAGVPTLYEALLRNENIKNMDLSYLKCIISGGDTLPVSLKNKVDNFLKEHGANVQIREGYGLTECVTGSCLTPINYYKQGSIGIPYPDTYYKIVKPGTEEELDYNIDGEIVLSGPSVMRCYLNDEKETNNVLRKHKDGLLWLHTGDLGCMDEDGFIYFRQRIKRMIVSSGYNIYPQHIENVLNQLPLVEMSCVVPKPHQYKGQVVKAYIILKDNIAPTEDCQQKIMRSCEKELPRYSMPYEIEFVKEFPKTLVGKIAYTKLMEDKR